MQYSSKDNIKEELKWKKAIQRRLLDSGHDGSSARLLLIVGCITSLLVFSVLMISDYWMTPKVSDSINDSNQFSSHASNAIAVVLNNRPNEATESKLSEITADITETSLKNEIDLQASDSRPKDTQNADNDIQIAFQKESTSAPVVLFSKTFCPFCTEIKKILLPYNQNSEGEKVVNVLELDRHPDGRLLLDGIEQIVGRRSVPQTFINGEFIGGLRSVKEAEESGELAKIILNARTEFQKRQAVHAE